MPTQNIYFYLCKNCLTIVRSTYYVQYNVQSDRPSDRPSDDNESQRRRSKGALGPFGLLLIFKSIEQSLLPSNQYKGLTDKLQNYSGENPFRRPSKPLQEDKRETGLMYVKSPVVVRKETETPKCRSYGQVTVLSKVKYQESSTEKKDPMRNPEPFKHKVYGHQSHSYLRIF